MVQRVTNPAFPRAIPHAIVGIDSLLRVLLFGSLPGSQKGPKMSPEMDPKRDRKWVTKWTREATKNGSPKGYSTLEPGNLYLDTQTRNLNSNSKPNSIVEL